MSMREEADAIAREPWFWPNYRTSKLAQAIERPLSDPSWQNGVLNAYAQTRPTFTARTP